jgi:hypothetical protein
VAASWSGISNSADEYAHEPATGDTSRLISSNAAVASQIGWKTGTDVGSRERQLTVGGLGPCQHEYRLSSGVVWPGSGGVQAGDPRWWRDPGRGEQFPLRAGLLNWAGWA